MRSFHRERAHGEVDERLVDHRSLRVPGPGGDKEGLRLVGIEPEPLSGPRSGGPESQERLLEIDEFVQDAPLPGQGRQPRRPLAIAAATRGTGEQKGRLPIRGAPRDEWLEDRDGARVVMIRDRPPRQVEST